MKTIAVSLLLLAMVSCALPEPHCRFKPMYNNLPLTIYEILKADMSDFATGYNLDFKIKVGQDIGRVLDKLTLNDKLNLPLGNILSYYVEHNGNTWGKQVYFLVEHELMTYLYHGIIRDKNNVPVLDDEILVEFSPDVQCFDVAVFLDYGIGIVDCAVVSKNALGFTSVSNKFIYFDLGMRQLIKEVKNPMYVPFTQVTRRSLTHFNDPHTGYKYVLRSYYAGGVDSVNANNTYLYLFSAYDPLYLQIIKVIDRTFLHINQLYVADFKVYLGDIFMLDYLNGLFRLDITHGQQIVVTMRHLIDTYTRFSVYSDDLDEELLIAFANSHTVQEVDLSVQWDPKLVSKYSLMPHSHVQSIHLDKQYLVVQTTANATDTGNKTLNYTWIFTKDVRTYRNVFKVISHNTSSVFVDLDRQNHNIMVFSSVGISNYRIANPTLMLMQNDATKINQHFTVTIEALSTDPQTITQYACTQTFTVNIVQDGSMALWKTGLTVPTNYYGNYPGTIDIPLLDYVLGPNITYNVRVNSSHDNPTWYIHKVNASNITFDNPPSVGHINFFHTEVVPHYSNETVIYYYQDIMNLTHVANCIHLGDDKNLYCTVVRYYGHNSRIYRFASHAFADSRGFSYYYYMFTLEGSKNHITIVDYIRHQRIAVIELPTGYEGEVESLAVSNGYLYALVKNIKTIFVYRMEHCADFECPVAFIIDVKQMKALGVTYFAPRQLITSREHPEVLFIKNLGSIIILDVDNHMRLHLLDYLFSATIQDQKSKIVVNRNSLVVVGPPDSIDHYDLTEMYSARRIVQAKNYYLYNYVIPDDFDLEFSDIGSLFYINTIDKNTNTSSLLIYRTTSFSAAALYTVINLPGQFTHKNLEVEISGYDVDYVSIIASGEFYTYRVFEKPHMIIHDTFSDFTFQIGFSNPVAREMMTEVTVKIANYPEDFEPTSEFKSKNGTLKASHSSTLSLETRKWWKGHVLRYNYSCPDCKDKVKVYDHVHTMRNITLPGRDFAETFFGGIVLWDDLIRLHSNGSVRDILHLPDAKNYETCVRVSSRGDDSLIVTGCYVFLAGVDLYLTSMASNKGFTWGPFRSTAIFVRNLELVHEIVAVTDVNPSSWIKYRGGGVYLYAVEMDPLTTEELEELDYIDSNDFMDAHGWEYDYAFIGNSHLVYDHVDDEYRLYITEVTRGLFVLDFKYKVGTRYIEVISTNFIDLNEILKSHDLHMPNDGSFLAVNMVGSIYNPQFEMENIVVTTNGYHNFYFTIIYDHKGKVTQSILHRVYYRYGNYEGNNNLRTTRNGYMALTYAVPWDYEWSTWNKQILVVYDTKDYEGDAVKGYSYRYMLGAYTLNHTDHAAFGFNTTFDPMHNATRTGLVVIDPQTNIMTETSVSRNLTIYVVDSNIVDQKLTLIPYNDFNKARFTIDIKGGMPNPDTITSDVLIALIILGFFVLVSIVGYLFMTCRQYDLPEHQRSLLSDVENPDSMHRVSMPLNQSLSMGKQSEVVAPSVLVAEPIAAPLVEQVAAPVVVPPVAYADSIADIPPEDMPFNKADSIVEPPKATYAPVQ